MSLNFKRFVSDRNYAISKLIYVGVITLLMISLYVLFLIAAGIYNQVEGDEVDFGNTINVMGEAEVTAVPDVSKFNFSVNITSLTVEEAQDESATIVNSAISFLKSNGVDEKDIKTTSYNIYPKYEYVPCAPNAEICQSTNQMVGQQVSQTVEVTLRDTDKSGDMVSGLGRKGITNISSLRFEIDDPSKFEEEARSEAIANAKSKAKRLAKDLGVDLEDIVSFSEERGGYYPEPYFAERALGGMSEDSSVSPKMPTGENTVKSVVYITFEID